MAIGKRGAQQYYYRKRLRGRRVLSIYVGKVEDPEVKAVTARDMRVKRFDPSSTLCLVCLESGYHHLQNPWQQSKPGPS